MKKRSTRILSVLLAVLLFCSALLPCSFAATAEEWDENWDRLKKRLFGGLALPRQRPLKHELHLAHTDRQRNGHVSDSNRQLNEKR